MFYVETVKYFQMDDIFTESSVVFLASFWQKQIGGHNFAGIPN